MFVTIMSLIRKVADAASKHLLAACAIPLIVHARHARAVGRQRHVPWLRKRYCIVASSAGHVSESQAHRARHDSVSFIVEFRYQHDIAGTFMTVL